MNTFYNCICLLMHEILGVRVRPFVLASFSMIIDWQIIAFNFLLLLVLNFFRACKDVFLWLGFSCFRFLKARKFDLDRTVQMWKEMLNWRDEYRVDYILQVWSLKYSFIFYGFYNRKILWCSPKVQTENARHSCRKDFLAVYAACSNLHFFSSFLNFITVTKQLKCQSLFSLVLVTAEKYFPGSHVGLTKTSIWI